MKTNTGIGEFSEIVWLKVEQYLGPYIHMKNCFFLMNFVNFINRNKLGNKQTARCVKLMNAEYEPHIKKLPENKQQQISH